jgi:hypothetical protein
MQTSTTSTSRPSALAWMTPSATLARISVTGFLVALLLFIVVVGFLQDLSLGDLAVSILLTAVLLTGMLAVGARNGILALAPVLVIPGLIAKWVNHFMPDIMPAAVYLIFALVFLLLVAGHFLRFMLRVPRVDAQVLQAGVATYLVLGVLWAFAYMLVAELIPNSFTFDTKIAGESMDTFNALYYSFTSLTTVGYGDITPLKHAARLLSLLESVAGTIYTTVLIARLVGLYLFEGFRAERDEDSRPDRSRS